MNKRKTGSEYEGLAAKWLENHGYRIVERNYRCGQGEIDLIGRDGRYLVFFEVKYRKTARNGMPAEAVGYAKQQKIRYTAQFYLYSRRYRENMPCRFDVVSILGDQISWIRDAFE